MPEPLLPTERCPLCAEPNACAVARGSPVDDCWCVSEEFPPALLERLPEADRGRACICRGCLREHRARAGR